MAPPDGLFFDQIIKTFGGTHALRGVSLRDGRIEAASVSLRPESDRIR